MRSVQLVKQFARAQLSAFLGGLVDYLVMLFFTEAIGFHYVLSIAIGGIIGAVCNFTINRYWAFNSVAESTGNQLVKFIFVVIGSILLKSSGTYFLTELFYIDYRISRLLTDAVVSFGFNYLLQKFWVFRK